MVDYTTRLASWLRCRILGKHTLHRLNRPINVQARIECQYCDYSVEFSPAVGYFTF